MNGGKSSKMVMCKSKIKLNFNRILFFLLIVNLFFSQGIIINDGSATTHSIFGDYSKKHNLKDYNYKLSYGIVFKGNTELNLSYLKENHFYRQNTSSAETSIWEEFISIGVSYYYKSDFFLNCGFKTKFDIPKKDIQNRVSSFSFLINKKIIGNLSTGLTYVPYLEFRKDYKGKYSDVLENIRDASNIFENSDNIELGCYITFNDFWIKPYYKENLDNSYKYEGIEIGFWDKAFY